MIGSLSTQNPIKNVLFKESNIYLSKGNSLANLGKDLYSDSSIVSSTLYHVLNIKRVGLAAVNTA
jgi:hypothetical protein